MKNNNLVLDVEENPKKISSWILFALQHVLAMLVACITVPIATGLPIAPTLIAAGVGTILYLLITKFKSPVFLSSSFAYIVPMQSALEVGLIYGYTGKNYLALIIGMILVGLVYLCVGLIVKLVGTKWINKLLPPLIVGPIIIIIGLQLSSAAVSNLTTNIVNGEYNFMCILSGLVALFATCIVSTNVKNKTINLIPFVIGMFSGYIFALIVTLIGFYGFKCDYFHIVDINPLIDNFKHFSFNSIFNYKLFVINSDESFIFLHFEEISHFNIKSLLEITLLFVPVAFVTICEHIGDHKNLGNIINRDLLNEEPGMTRTLIGDGLASSISGVLCGASNTTYGENVAVIGTTKIASSKVILLAAFFAIGFGFFTPFTCLLRTIPNCVTGGVSLILYGFIASSGIKMLVKEKIDITKSKNIFIISSMLVSGIGGLIIQFKISSTNIQISSLVVSMILGIILNLVLKDNEKEKIQE